VSTLHFFGAHKYLVKRIGVVSGKNVDGRPSQAGLGLYYKHIVTAHRHEGVSLSASLEPSLTSVFQGGILESIIKLSSWNVHQNKVHTYSLPPFFFFFFGTNDMCPDLHLGQQGTADCMGDVGK
jgi:hypothetical protein